MMYRTVQFISEPAEKAKMYISLNIIGINKKGSMVHLHLRCQIQGQANCKPSKYVFWFFTSVDNVTHCRIFWDLCSFFFAPGESNSTLTLLQGFLSQSKLKMRGIQLC